MRQSDDRLIEDDLRRLQYFAVRWRLPVTSKCLAHDWLAEPAHKHHEAILGGQLWLYPHLQDDIATFEPYGLHLPIVRLVFR